MPRAIDNMISKGIIAAGHEETARAGQIILDEGGNAFDAAMGAFCAACVVEPVFASLGGGGFLLAHSPAKSFRSVLYDFFVQTPKKKRLPEEVDFFPILADFGEAQQKFYAGLGSMATPGSVKGLFQVNKELGSMPMEKIIEPAVKLAKEGVVVNQLQGYIFSIVKKIFTSNESCIRAYSPPKQKGKLVGAGDLLIMPEFADTLDALAYEGDDLFYRGEIGEKLAKDCKEIGGHLFRVDLESYRLKRRSPLHIEYLESKILTNPPPSTGGILIAFGLGLLEETDLCQTKFGSKKYLELLAKTMILTNEARIESSLQENPRALENILNADFLADYKERTIGRPKAYKGTTHISVTDASGNVAALSVSNGEGSAYIVPGTGIMINNMLGEEDINPHGLNNWPLDMRMSSMMSPSLVFGKGGELIALGSGGSNRIRTAILQVIINLINFGMPLSKAIESTRMHYDSELLSVESGFDRTKFETVDQLVSEVKFWSQKNLFFGGVHGVQIDTKKGVFVGAGDPRRGGISLSI